MKRVSPLALERLRRIEAETRLADARAEASALLRRVATIERAQLEAAIRTEAGIGAAPFDLEPDGSIVVLPHDPPAPPSAPPTSDPGPVEAPGKEPSP